MGRRPGVTVALVIYGDLDNRSGGFRYDRRLVDRLRARGHRVEIVSQREGSLLRRIMRPDDRMPEVLCEFEADLLLVDELNHPSFLFRSRRIKKVSGIPLVLLVHHLASRESRGYLDRVFHRWMEALMIRCCDGVIAVSASTLKDTRRLAGYRGIPSVIAPPSAENPIGTPAEGRGPMRILFVGTLGAHKGIGTLLDAFARMDPGTAELDVVGRLPDTRKSRFFLDQKVEAGRKVGPIRLHGRIPDEHRDRLYLSSDVLAVPSAVEGFGMVYLEAMRGGTVPIASAVGGADDLVQEGYDGFLVPPDDPDILFRRLKRLAEDPGLRMTMASAAREKALSWPSWVATLDRAARFLEGFAGAG